MGMGICADDYVGDRDAQLRFRAMFGGNSELPIDTRRRLDEQKRQERSRRGRRKVSRRTR